jgi:hypothetical protein
MQSVTGQTDMNLFMLFASLVRKRQGDERTEACIGRTLYKIMQQQLRMLLADLHYFEKQKKCKRKMCERILRNNEQMEKDNKSLMKGRGSFTGKGRNYHGRNRTQVLIHFSQARSAAKLCRC